MENYYGLRSYVSNSMLTELQIALGERPAFGDPSSKERAYAFGNLYDALMTEPDLIVESHRAVRTSEGELIEFDQETYDRAQAMRRDAMEHHNMTLLLSTMKFQVVHKVEDFEIDSETARFTMPIRCKLDGEARRIKTGWDLKSTACPTEKAFIDSIDFFDYDRQGVLYMDVAGLDYFWFTGVGKQIDKKTRKHPVFFYVIQRGDATYLRGRAKYQRLAELYHLTVLGLNPALIQLQSDY